MRITPLDIRKQEFRKAMRGLDAEEVYAFLSTVGDEYETVLNDNKALRDRLLELDDKVQEYRSMEKTLRDTLLTAERVTVDAKDNARREANLIIKEAQIEVERSLRDVKSEAMKLRQEVTQLRSQRESYLGRMKVIAESLLKFIQGVEDDFDEEDQAFSDQLPEDSVLEPAASAAPPVPQTDAGGLFDSPSEGDKLPAEDAAKSVQPQDKKPESASAASVVTNEPERKAEDLEVTGSGIPSDLRAPGVADSHSSVAPRLPGGDKDASTANEARNEVESQPTMVDVNSIIERMAAGQKEIVGQSSREPGGLSTDATRDTEQFDPLPASPSAPITSRDPSDEPPQTLEATTDDPTPARGIAGGQLPAQPTTPVERAWERTPEVATAVGTVDAKEDSAPKPPDVAPAGDDVTSEISMDQIRRDLERRILKERGGK